jgi:hypothetical protein
MMFFNGKQLLWRFRIKYLSGLCELYYDKKHADP